MKATWTDVQLAYERDKISTLDKETLEAFARVHPPERMSEVYRPRWNQIQHQIGRALERIDSAEREARERIRHRYILLATVIGAAAASVAAYFAWRPRPTAALPSQPPAAQSSASSPQMLPPTQSVQKP